jgi:ABC-type dipeptide/oligopeptide/nickel transport system permease component
MLRYIVGRLLSILLTFFVVSVIVFLIMHSVPGGSFDGNDMPVSDAVKVQLNASLGLDKPLYEQYFRYMCGVLQFDFGVPFQSPGVTVTELLARAWPPSLTLGGLGVLIGAPIGILLGMAAALRRNIWFEYLVSALSTMGPTIPVFVISMMLIMVFSVWLNWLPAGGWEKPYRWILPITAYAAVPMATYARYTRSAMLDVMNKPFVTVRRAKGLSERRIIFQHVLSDVAPSIYPA